MNASGTFSQHHWIGLLYLGSAVTVFVGVMMFTYRMFLHGRLFPGFVRWERGLVALAASICMLAFLLLAAGLWSVGERTLSSLALGVLALGTALIVFAELRTVFGMDTGTNWMGAVIPVGVALTFIGQAIYGLSLLQTALAPTWTGWLLVAWNLGWLVVVFAFSARDPYFPVLFYTGPIVLGLLLWR